MADVDDLFLNAEDSDCKIRLYSERDQHAFEVPGHAFLIRHVSTVLKTMLSSKDFSPKVLELKVKGNKNVAMTFLRYMYMHTKQLEQLDTFSLVALTQTAHLYAVNILLKLCEQRIRESVTPYSACNVFLALKDITSEEFGSFLLALILKSAFLIFKNKLHLSLNEETMKHLLASDWLTVLSEEQVLDALWAWGKANCDFESKTGEECIKNKIAELLPLIRWSLICNFEDTEPWSDLVKAYKDNPDITTVGRKSNMNVTIHRFVNVFNPVMGLSYTYHKYSNHDDTVHLMSFTVKRDIIILGVALHLEYSQNVSQGNLPLGSGLSFYILIDDLPLEDVTHKETFTGTVEKGYKWLPRATELNFRKPLLIKNTNLHTIHMHLSGSPRSIAAAVYNVNINVDPIFEVSGEVTALLELYYVPF